MNIKDKHNISLPISEISLFESQVGITSSLFIMEGVYLENQIIKVPALLVCVDGRLVYQDENGKDEVLDSGDLINIKPMIKYSLRGLTNSQTLIMK
ncbi:MAG TPA: hypothetical protein EYG92_07755 [Lutibacter sp.]|nr:hypothetical protein [Lutibacter sp.]